MNESEIKDALKQGRNTPREHGIRVPFEAMQTFVAELFSEAGLRD